jgi:hypothetical protein
MQKQPQTVLLQQQRKSMSVEQELVNKGLPVSEVLYSSYDNLHAVMQ